MTTRILPPRIALVEPRTGGIAREWYLYFLALAGDVTGLQDDPFGLAPLMSTANGDPATVAQNALGLGPVIDSGNIAAAIASDMQIDVSPSTAGLAARVDALERLVDDLRKGTTVL